MYKYIFEPVSKRKFNRHKNAPIASSPKNAYLSLHLIQHYIGFFSLSYFYYFNLAIARPKFSIKYLKLRYIIMYNILQKKRLWRREVNNNNNQIDM